MQLIQQYSIPGMVVCQDSSMPGKTLYSVALVAVALLALAYQPTIHDACCLCNPGGLDQVAL